ncbi:MAG TPA: hypothetical protein O0X25_04090 [Methanocorpusculum sp.]|nr:hypothetical protein [Methanocorpusculum sp.]HJJ49779.1 hypothetical protein [Methanocorpusculum sp.]HJJ57383.1 hypothetical protein [Methanocorpusculum sp.]
MNFDSRDFERKLSRYVSHLSSAMDTAVLTSAETVRKSSQDLCPVATGVLRDSALTAFERSGDEIRAVVGYTVSYAAPVHERKELKHATGQAKFLEDAVKQYEPQYLRDLGKAAGTVR